jgi:hypothetical protein
MNTSIFTHILIYHKFWLVWYIACLTFWLLFAARITFVGIRKEKSEYEERGYSIPALIHAYVYTLFWIFLWILLIIPYLPDVDYELYLLVIIVCTGALIGFAGLFFQKRLLLIVISMLTAVFPPFHLIWLYERMAVY